MTVAIRKAVIPAAGFGTRFLPASKVTPKELFPIVDIPAVQYIVQDLAEAGVEDFIFVLSPGKEAILDHFRQAQPLENFLKARQKNDLLDILRQIPQFGNIHAVYQDEPRGLGHAVLCAEKAIGREPFLVALPDDLIDANPSSARQMVDLYAEHGKSMVCVQEVSEAEVNKYGIVAPAFAIDHPQYFADTKKMLIPLKDLVEKPEAKNAPSRLAIIGRYLLKPEIFSILKQTAVGSGGEIQLTDGLRALNQKESLLAYRFKGQRFDAGDRAGYLQANVHFGLKHPELGKKLEEYLKKRSL